MNKLEQAALQALGALVRAEAMYGQPNADIQTALREALAVSEQRMEEQAEHMPYCKQAPMCKTPCGNPDCVEQAEQEPVGYFAYDEEHDIWEELTGPNAPGATPLYAAPIRVQDLTDDEIDEIYSEYGSIPNTKAIRAVIAKYREKNK